MAGDIRDRLKQVESGCCEWQGALSKAGYGVVHVDGRLWLVHRLVWTIANGEIPEGQCVLHKCDNRRCGNVEHLFVGSRPVNNADMRAKGRDVPPPVHVGEMHHSAKLTHEQVTYIRQVHQFSPGRGVKARLARRFHVSAQTITQIVNDKTWRAL